MLRITSLWLKHSRHIQTLFVSVFCFFAIGFLGGFCFFILLLLQIASEWYHVEFDRTFCECLVDVTSPGCVRPGRDLSWRVTSDQLKNPMWSAAFRGCVQCVGNRQLDRDHVQQRDNQSCVCSGTGLDKPCGQLTRVYQSCVGEGL